jgi:hypothetical protein
MKYLTRRIAEDRSVGSDLVEWTPLLQLLLHEKAINF